MERTYEVKYTCVVEREVTCQVKAEGWADAVKKVTDGDYDFSDEDMAPEDIIELKDFEVNEVLPFNIIEDESMPEDEVRIIPAKDK